MNVPTKGPTPLIHNNSLFFNVSLFFFSYGIGLTLPIVVVFTLFGYKTQRTILRNPSYTVVKTLKGQGLRLGLRFVLFYSPFVVYYP